MYETLLLWFGFGLCHQLPERSFFGGGVQVPVCARDTGIYVGFVVSLLVIGLLQRNRPAGFPSAPVTAVLVLFVVAMAADGVTSYAGFRETTNAIRLATGLLAGYAMGAIAAPLLNDGLWRSASSDRVLGSRRVLAAWLASIVVSYAAVMWVDPLLGPAYPLLVVVCILGTLTAVNLLIVCLLPMFERRAERLADAWVPLVLAFTLSWAEVALSAGVKIGLAKIVGG